MSKAKRSAKPYATYKQASAATGIPDWKLRRWVWDKRLPSYKPDGPRGVTFLRIEDIHTLVESSRFPSN